VSEAAPIARQAGSGVVSRLRPARRRSAPSAGWTAGVVLLAAALAASLSAPSAAGTALHIALAQSFGTQDVTVNVAASPASAAWWGNIDMLSVAARSLHMGRLDVAAFDATLRRVDVDAGLLYGRRRLSVRSVGGGEARVVVTADNLARLIAAEPVVKQVVVHLKPGAIVLDGTIDVFGADFPASLVGRLVVRDATHLDLAIDRVTVLGGLPVPSDVAGRLAASVNPVLDVGRLPFDLRLTGVTMGDGRVTLRAEVPRTPMAEGQTP
jgi:LmeA-like phospholipid-binding